MTRAGRGTSGIQRSIVMLLAGMLAAPINQAAQLPVPCAAGACGASVNFVSGGAAKAVQSGSQLTVTQSSNTALLNWKTFNISADGTVQFVQPGKSAVALNQIFQSSPSSILGRLNANGQVFLINQNGIIFGSTAQVNVGSLTASTLMIDPAVVATVNGQPTVSLLQPAAVGRAAFSQSPGGAAGAITVQPGATLQSGANGQVLLFAPEVVNRGTISTPGGQTMLAAGTEIYLAASEDPNLRGLLVEVGNAAAPASTPTVTNGTAANATASSAAQLVGQLIADHGNVTLAGLAVNQQGRVSATTSVRENGSIVLQARSGTLSTNNEAANSVAPNQTGGYTLTPQTGGNLILGPKSVTGVTLDTSDTETTVDSVPPARSQIQAFAANVQIQSGSTVTATGGNIAVTALVDQTVELGATGQADASRIYVAPSATLDVSGTSVELPASANVIAAQLRGTEFANFPVQRNGPLRGSTVYVDANLYGTRADGTPWVGSPIADLSGEVAAIQRNVAERNLNGGALALRSQGDVIVAPGATIDIKGGAVHYDAGYLNTTQLITAAGTIVDISRADPNVVYSGIAERTTSSTDAKWGQTTTYNQPGTQSSYNWQPAYVQGADAGSLTLVAPRFTFDGALQGQATVGQYQQLPSLPQSAWPSASLYRPYNELPLTATLIAGESVPQGTPPDYVLGNVSFTNQLILPTLGQFDPVHGSLPDSLTTSVVRPGLIGTQGVGHVEVYADGAVGLPRGSSLEFPAEGSLRITANRVALDGSIDALAGQVSATAINTFTDPPGSTQGPALELGPQASILVRGAWVNDNPAVNPAGTSAPLLLAGGSVALNVIGGNLTLAPGSLIDVSGGAHLSTGGSLTGGAGGSIQLGVRPFVSGSDVTHETLSLGGTLRGEALRSGGSLSVAADSVCIAAADCRAGDATALWLTPAWFTQGGFGSYSIASTLGGLSVEPGTAIKVTQQNLLPPPDIAHHPSAAAFESLAQTTLLSPLVRQPTSLSLAAGIATPVPLSAEQIAATPSLSIGSGALITVDPLASVSLVSNTRIIDEGTINAPAGKVSLTLNSKLSVSEFSGTQAIWLGPNGVINAAGIAQIFPSDTGLTTGAVLPGGSVTVDAQRGYFEMLPGSIIDVSGASGKIDQLQVVGPTLQPVLTPIASAGGSVALTAAEGMALDGVFRAAPGAGSARTPAGGSLSIALDPELRNLTAQSGTITFPSAPRDIVLSQTTAPLVIKPGTPVPDAYNGQALVSADALQTAGFSGVALQAGIAHPDGTGFAFGGVISTAGNVSFSMGDFIQLDAGALKVADGTTALLSAPYLSLGNSDVLSADYATASAGTGHLTLQGQSLIELYGSVALQGASQATFASGGDIRLLGVQIYETNSQGQPIPAPPVGALSSDGNLSFRAAQLYPTTLAQFTISTAAETGLIDIERSTTHTDSIWSAGGTLVLAASHIEQNGDLRAPFGQIVLEGPLANVNGATLELGAGSLTSTAADGLVIPFGSTQGGFSWTYLLPSGSLLVYGTDGIAPPAQQVRLIGSNITLAGAQGSKPKALIDVAGGGDMFASEFLPNAPTGGTVDILASTTSFAVVPTINSGVAPYDPYYSLGSPLALGQSVYLAGAPNLPAGTYTLLPARYALLPGAFLVTPVSGYVGITPGQQYPYPGGGTIVSGYQTIAGTTIAGSQTSGFAVVPAAVFGRQATYTTTLASQFFPSQAKANGATAPRLPQDAGILSVAATSELVLNGALNAAAGNGGLGGEIDIASANIEVVPDQPATQPGTGVITLSVSDLEQLGAQTLLLGGLRTGNSIETDAQSVVFAPGAALTAPEVLVAARDQIVVSKGATVAASGSAPPPGDYQLSGDGAFMNISAGPLGSVTRSGTTGASAAVDLQSGSRLSAPKGSIYLDGTSVSLDGTLALSGGDLGIRSSRIGLLGAQGSAGLGSGTLLGPDVLSAGTLRSLYLQSGSGFDLYGPVVVNAKDLTLDGATLVGHGSATEVAKVTVSGTLQLSNMLGAVDPLAPGNGTGMLTFDAGTISAGGGHVDLTGFSAVAMNTAGEFSAAADSSLATAGNLSITAARVTTASDVELSLAAAGALRLTAPQTPEVLPAVGSLGGAVQLSGASVELGTTLALPAGTVRVTSTGSGGDVRLDPGARIEVAGIQRTFQAAQVSAPGGSVSIESTGDVVLGAGSVINVSAAPGGNAGNISISAPAGSFRDSGSLAGSSAAGRGGSFHVDALNFGDFGTLNRSLNAAGFTGDRYVELRGPGDLTLAADAGDNIRASNVALVADAGNVTTNGLIDVSGVSAGSVLLAASGTVTVAGTIDAYSTGAGQRGGAVQLMTSGGDLQFLQGGRINVTGGPADSYGNAGLGGTVLARAPQQTVAAVATGGTGVVWQGLVSGSRQSTLEGFLRYDWTGTPPAADPTVPGPYQDAVLFMNSAPGILSNLHLPSGSALQVQPGIEFDATDPVSALTLSSPWNLYTWRFNGDGTPGNGVPGILTLRAAGGLALDATLSDGFAATSGSAAYALPSVPGDSWSYRLIGGADLSSANVLAVNASSPADVALGAGTIVRTGTGSIDVAASGNFTLAQQTSVLYTAGVAGPGISLPYNNTGTIRLPYPTDGGDITLHAGGDILGAASNQFVTPWLWRPLFGRPGAMAWTVNFQYFQQGVAALGGGNVRVDAGGDIRDLSVSVPSIGRQVGGTTDAASVVQVTGGGNLQLRAGGSILGGSYYVGLGTGELAAGNDVGGGALADGTTELPPLVGLGDGRLHVGARGNVELGGILNPTLVPLGRAQNAVSSSSFFSTYGQNSSVALIATGGNVTLADNSTAFESALSGIAPNWQAQNVQVTAFNVLPSSFVAAALEGDVTLGGLLGLSPAPKGNLQILAHDSITGSGQVILSDADPQLLPSAQAPATSLAAYQYLQTQQGEFLPAGGSFALAGSISPHAQVPVHSLAAQPDGVPDVMPAEVIAQTGDISFIEGAGIISAKPVFVSAGRDILGLGLVAQNLTPADVSIIVAGGTLNYPILRGPTGYIVGSAQQIALDGPGALQITTGGGINLGDSGGISTRGNLVSPALPAEGASVTATAGIAGHAPDYQAVLDTYVYGSTAYDAALIAYVEHVTGLSGLSADMAKALFKNMTTPLRQLFADQVTLSEINTAGTQAVRSGSNDYTDAFAALTTLFPGANPNLSKNELNPYQGNVDLYFSRIYTLAGGDISILAPGGGIDVGLASPPAAFGITKAAQDLGIVAQGVGDVNALQYRDFQVNTSRVFAADGGNILVWSTDGNIDAGRGAKTAISAPPPTITIGPNGQPIVTFPAVLTGSGIQTLATTEGVEPGDVSLFAPHGVVNANDAGIVAGNLVIGATAVLGAGNISVSGTAIGVPVEVTGLGASVSGATSAAAGAATAAAESAASSTGSSQSTAPQAESAVGWLDVFLVGLGEENCKPDDLECLKHAQEHVK